MPNPSQLHGGNVLTLPSQKLLLSLSLDDLGKFVRRLDMEELTELLHFYETKEYFEACIIVNNYINHQNKRITEQSQTIFSA